jgi:hypothetical protein
MSQVRCYAGTRYPERPLAFEHRGHWLEVAEILREERTPHGLTFHVLAMDGQRYRLAWDESGDAWSIALCS